jgi:hypothetical protein
MAKLSIDVQARYEVSLVVAYLDSQLVSDAGIMRRCNHMSYGTYFLISLDAFAVNY